MPTRRRTAAAKSSAAGAGSATAAGADDEESAPPPTQWAMLIKDFYTTRVFVDDTPAAALHAAEVTNDAKSKASICSLATGGSMRSSSSSGPMPSTPLRTTTGFSHRHQSSMHGSLKL